MILVPGPTLPGLPEPSHRLAKKGEGVGVGVERPFGNQQRTRQTKVSVLTVLTLLLGETHGQQVQYVTLDGAQW